jgi:hypothetical protein
MLDAAAHGASNRAAFSIGSVSAASRNNFATLDPVDNPNFWGADRRGRRGRGQVGRKQRGRMGMHGGSFLEHIPGHQLIALPPDGVYTLGTLAQRSGCIWREPCTTPRPERPWNTSRPARRSWSGTAAGRPASSLTSIICHTLGLASFKLACSVGSAQMPNKQPSTHDAFWPSLVLFGYSSRWGRTTRLLFCLLTTIFQFLRM